MDRSLNFLKLVMEGFMRIIVFLFALVLMAQPKAEAGVLIEPYVGYQSMLTTVTLGTAATPFDGQSIKLNGSGIGFGLRAGYAMSMLFVAADYSSANLTTSVKELPAGLTSTFGDITRTSLGVTAGLDFPMVRPYLGYVFDDQSKDSTTTNMGSGFKVGIGFTIIPKLKLNAEYQTLTYTKAKSSSGTETTFSSSNSISAMTASGFFVNLSVPLEL
jgi:hypothetical protein